MPQLLSNTAQLAGAFVVRDPDWRRKIFFGGLLLLFVHPIGWPVTLGYRKALIARLVSGTEPLLPEWRGNIGHYFVEGVKAVGVIFGYLLPLYGTLLLLLLLNGVMPNISWLYAALFFLLLPIFSTLSFPLSVFYWTFFSATYRLPPTLAIVLLVLFATVVFFIPAGFLQVSKTGRYLAAFQLRAAASTLRRHFRRYVLAWYHSIVLSLVGHFALPFAPWGVVWCYLGIIFEFNSILDDEPGLCRSGSWYEKLRGADALLVEETGKPRFLRCTNAGDGESEECVLLEFGPILIPLPHLASKLLFQ